MFLHLASYQEWQALNNQGHPVGKGLMIALISSTKCLIDPDNVVKIYDRYLIIRFQILLFVSSNSMEFQKIH